MKNFVIGSLIALAATQAAGCIITSDDTSDAYVSATWSIKSLATNTTATCPPGFDTAALYNQPVDSAGNNVGSPVIDLFNCSDFAGTSAPLAPGLYLSWIEIANTNNTSVYAQSTSAYVDVTTSDKTFSAEILSDGGYFQLAWNLVGATSGSTLDCSSAPGGVESLATDVANANNAASDQFDCADRSGITSGFLAGTYTVSVAALNSSDQSVGTAPELTNKVIQSPNKVTNLGTVNIPITGL
jgi:hypothetical protein